MIWNWVVHWNTHLESVVWGGTNGGHFYRNWLGISEKRREAIWWRVSDQVQSTSCLHEGLPLPLLDADGRLLSATHEECLGTGRGVVMTATQTSWQICLVTPWCLKKGSTKPGWLFDIKTIKLCSQNLVIWSFFCKSNLFGTTKNSKQEAKRLAKNFHRQHWVHREIEIR